MGARKVREGVVVLNLVVKVGLLDKVRWRR